MAQLRNLDKIHSAPLETLVTVGNNRQIMRVADHDGAPRFKCYLHGHCVAEIKPLTLGTLRADVFLDTCGYRTTTTIAAMKDFMGAFGISGGASRAGGELSARYKLDGEWCETYARDGYSLDFTADRVA